MINNYNRWGNFSNNNDLYNKYKQSQQPVASAPAPQQQQQGGGEQWNELGKNIGKTWRESLARRNDGVYKNGNIAGGAGSDAQNQANMQNIMSSNDLGLQNNSFGTTDWNSLANSPNAISMGEPIQLGAELGANSIGTGAGSAMAGNAIGAATTVAPEALASSLGASALEGGAMAGEAIGAGTTAAAEGAGATAAGAGASAVLGPLAAAYGVYKLGDYFDWW